MNSKRKAKIPSLRSTLGNEKGVILSIVIMLISTLAIIGGSAFIITRTEIKIADNWKDQVTAFYIAEGGIQRAVGDLNTVSNWIANLSDTSDAFAGDNTLGGGTYVVEVFDDDPESGKVRLRSTGNIASSSSATIIETVLLKPQGYGILDYAAIGCGNMEFKDSGNNLISGGDVFVSGNLELKGSAQIQNGDVSVLGNLDIKDSSKITGGNASANGNIGLESSANPNVGGNASAGGNVDGSGAVTGTKSPNVSPAPVTNQCTGTNLASKAITTDVIQDFRNNADTTISGNYEPPSNITLSGVVHVTGNFESSANVTFADNVVFIVDGNVEIQGNVASDPIGSQVTFIVPTGNFEVKGGGTFTMDGMLHLGTVNSDGSNIRGGNFEVKDGSNLTVNGSVMTLNGNLESKSGGDFTVNYQPNSDSNLGGASSYTYQQWREVF